MKKILITGINGSSASYLHEFLLNQRNVKLFGLARWNKIRNQSSDIDLIDCDLTDLSSVIRALEQSNPDIIFHLASNANVKLSFMSPIAIFNNNVNGTLNLLEGLRLLNLKPIIQFCGTSEVYGQIKKEDIPVKETHKIDPVNVYAISKLAQEKLVNSYYLSYNIPTVITRSFGYINPRREDIFSSAFAKQIVDIERGNQDVLYHGNLESVRTLLDVRDISRAYWLAANHCTVGQAYNIGSENPISVGDFLEELKRQAKCKVTSVQKSELMRPIDVTLQIPDVKKFQKETNFKPNYSLSESIKFLLDYYRNR
jgi:GDPmannose 4,6-dehydratase/GDP-4-dehydro-6-deoxy-D-mannose reductase